MASCFLMYNSLKPCSYCTRLIKQLLSACKQCLRTSFHKLPKRKHFLFLPCKRESHFEWKLTRRANCHWSPKCIVCLCRTKHRRQNLAAAKKYTCKSNIFNCHYVATSLIYKQVNVHKQYSSVFYDIIVSLCIHYEHHHLVQHYTAI